MISSETIDTFKNRLDKLEKSGLWCMTLSVIWPEMVTEVRLIWMNPLQIVRSFCVVLFERHQSIACAHILIWFDLICFVHDFNCHVTLLPPPRITMLLPLLVRISWITQKLFDEFLMTFLKEWDFSPANHSILVLILITMWIQEILTEFCHCGIKAIGTILLFFRLLLQSLNK